MTRRILKTLIRHIPELIRGLLNNSDTTYISYAYQALLIQSLPGYTRGHSPLPYLYTSSNILNCKAAMKQQQAA